MFKLFKIQTKQRRILSALKILEDLGLTIRDIYVKEDFLQEVRENKDSDLDAWVDKNLTVIGQPIFDKKSMKQKGKDFEGMMFGINFRRRCE